ncbi:hypothetical protein B296_00045184 [Ensete ventricosum]|uniref:Uncharacterized protein n=1 Tax=Ensete ventricosum TaxID=4639 RepID=A0A426YD80_ENSVE|nr:hypothetical protein B296_00045184 [Ensete ventricosum]
MSGNNITGVASDDGSFATRSLHESSSSRCDSGRGGATRLSVDLVTAARRHLSFLRSFVASPVLHHAPTIARAIRRSDFLLAALCFGAPLDRWLRSVPFLAQVRSAVDAVDRRAGAGGAAVRSSDAPPAAGRPLGVVLSLPRPGKLRAMRLTLLKLASFLFCARSMELWPPQAGSYREYCTSRFGALVDRPLIIDDENEEYAYNRCREVWAVRYPSVPFDLEVDSGEDGEASGKYEDHLSAVVARYRTLYSFFCDPFVSETVYLVAARRRYSSFLHLSRRPIDDGMLRMVLTSDIFLIWLTHQQSHPRSYAKDIEDMGDPVRVTVGFGDRATAEEAKETARAWEEALDEPYERAGAVLDPAASLSRVYFNWETAETDVNRSYKGLQPRFLMEVTPPPAFSRHHSRFCSCFNLSQVRIFLKGKWEEREDKHLSKSFLRLRTIRCNREMKLNEPVHDLSSETWHKTWHLYCEFGTRGIVIEVRRRGSSCLINSKLITKLVFLWNDLLRATNLMLKKELEMQVRALASITPPVQAPYLLKCVPDRVTDDGGAMISDVVLRMNRYHPQQGRWLSRTVLDHAKRECFVIRIR